MNTKELGVYWYNIERCFQDLQIKCEMVDATIDMLKMYKGSMEQTMGVLRHNLNALFETYGINDGQRNIKEQSDTKV